MNLTVTYSKVLAINENWVYISSWIPQLTILQHFFSLVIMDCGITGSQAPIPTH